MATTVFSHDVFLSHSSADKSVVRGLAERLRADGLRVWLDDWELRPGDSIPAKIEEGLAGSRILVLCMSAAAFGSDWARLESQTFQFRDPLNRERRFIPLRLDDAEPRGSLAQFLYVDWRASGDGAYAKLIEACRPPVVVRALEQSSERGRAEEAVWSLGHTKSVRSVAFSPDGRLALSGSDDKTVRLWDVGSGQAVRVLEGHTDGVTSVAFSPDGRHALSGSADNTVRLWEVGTGRQVRVLEGHTGGVLGVEFSPDGRHALSGSGDCTVRLWEVGTGRQVRVLEGHTDNVWGVAFSPDGRYALSGSGDKTVRLWEVGTGRQVRVLEGHTDAVMSVTFSPDGRHALSGSGDKTVRLWEVGTGREVGIFEGHTGGVWSVAFSPDGRHALSGSGDKAMRLWEVGTGRQVGIFEGRTGGVWSVAFSPDGRHALSGSGDKTVRLWEVGTGRQVRVLEGHTNDVTSVAFSPDRRLALSGSDDKTVRLWEVGTGRQVRVLEGHTGGVLGVAFSPDGRHALSGSSDGTVRLWEVGTGRQVRVLEGHTGGVLGVAFSPDGRHALSGSGDNTVRLWEVGTGRQVRVLEGHTDNVWGVAFSPDGRYALAGSGDNSMRLWEVETRRQFRVLEGHTNSVMSVAFSPDGRHALSGSGDKTVRLWEVETGRQVRVLEGHTNSVMSVAFSPDGRHALSGSGDNTVRLWEVGTGRQVRVLEGHTNSVWGVAFGPDGRLALSTALNGVLRVWRLDDLDVAEAPARASQDTTPVAAAPEQLQYTNAKVLLVGDSGGGKTGLSVRLAENAWRPSDSTVGAWATQWKLDVSAAGDTEREIWLWDFGGQADQRLVHQLFMDETRLAVLVFDPQRDDLLDVLGQWDRDLARGAKAAPGTAASPPRKLLVAGRVDAGGLRLARAQVEAFAAERGFAAYLETSAKVGTGCDALKKAIVEQIRWDELPWRSSPRLFKRLKDEIIRFKDQGRVLMRFKDLRDALALRLPGERFRDEELEAVLSLLAGPGVVWKLSFGSWVLLQPERVNAYAQAVVQTLRADQRDMGSIAEELVLAGELAYQSSLPRLLAEDERIVLLAMHQILVERGLCLREHTEHGTQLVFPSYYRRERPDIVGHPAMLVSYQFDGFLDEIYATLVVRLHHAEAFRQAELWRYAADFETLTGKRLGVKLARRAQGAGELVVYFDPDIPIEEQIIFAKYVHEHLVKNAKDVVRLRHYVCRKCKTPVGNREVAMQRLADGKQDIVCASCEARVALWDELEKRFAAPEAQRQVRERDERASLALDNESKERALVGDVISTVALAGQISRELTVSDHGIDMEIEFKSDDGEATGRKLYLVLEANDSHIARSTRGDAEIFNIYDERQARYWRQQPFPVMLVVRSSEGDVRWTKVREPLWDANRHAHSPVGFLPFDAERFDVMSVRRWRDRALTEGPA